MLEFIQLLATNVSRLKSDCSRLKINIYELIEMNRLLEGMEPGHESTLTRPPDAQLARKALLCPE